MTTIQDLPLYARKYAALAGLPTLQRSAMATVQTVDAIRLHAYDHNYRLFMAGEISSAEHTLNGVFLAGGGTDAMTRALGQFTAAGLHAVTSGATLYGNWTVSARAHIDLVMGL